MIKQAGGILTPADDRAAEQMQKLKTGEVYPVEAKRTRNPHFHGKVFAFLNYCFEHWCADKTHFANMSEPAQFDAFRKELTIMAGYFVVTYNINGGTHVEAKSLSYGSMSQDEFEDLYNALINAAIKNIFGGVDSPEINNRLMSFF